VRAIPGMSTRRPIKYLDQVHDIVMNTCDFVAIIFENVNEFNPEANTKSLNEYVCSMQITVELPR